MAMARSEEFKLENMRLSFPNLVKPQQIEDKGVVKVKYNATLLWPKTAGGLGLFGKTASGEKLDIASVALKVATEQWGEKAGEWIKNGTIKTPFLDGDGPQGVNKKSGERHAGYEGHRFIRTSANEDRKPRLFDKKLNPVTDLDTLYPGCYVNAVVNMYAWEHPQNGKGLSFGVSLVQFAKDGERLGGGGVNPSDFLESIDDEGEAPAETTTGAGAGGLFE